MPSPDSSPQERPPGEIELPCMPPDRRIVERLEEPLTEQVEYCIHAGNPCILFVDWDYAEDWSGLYVRVIPAETLGAALRVDAAEFWAAVRRVQGLSG